MREYNHINTADVLIVGGGGAGAFAAIKARETGAKEVLLVDKARAGKSGCTTFGAGVIKVFVEYGVLTEKTPPVDELFTNEYLP